MWPFDPNKLQLDAYCDAIFDHRSLLDDVEVRYVDRALAADRPASAGEHPISWKTYGHKIEGDRIVAFQLGLGFQSMTPSDVEAIEAVLGSWLGASSLSPYCDLLARSRGAGLGWVFPQGQRRLYFFFEGPDGGVELRHQRHLAELCLPEFILGYTFDGSTLVESKTYHYPHRPHWPRLLQAYSPDREQCLALAANAHRLALVVSREGAPRLQFDVSHRTRTATLHALGSPTALEIARRCEEIFPPLQLDTVAMTRAGSCLYFQ